MTERTIKSAHQRDRVKTYGDPDRKTKAVQSEKHASNINNIVAKAHVTKQLPVLMHRQPIENLPTDLSYQDALNKVVYAQQSFARLPSEIRTKFDNDPAKLLQALQDPTKNLDLLVEASVLEPVKEIIDPILAELRKINEPPAKPSGGNAAPIGGEASA